MGSKSAIGIGNGICFKQVRDKGGGSYIDPLVRDSIVGLWKFYQNTNESPTRNIIKNTIKDKGGDLELLNFGYKLNSGYGKYIEDFSLFTLSNRFEYSEISNTKVTITAVLYNSTGIYHSVKEEDSALYWNTFKIKVSGSTDDVYISYITDSKNIRLYNGINTVVVPNDLSWHSFTASATNVSCNITLEFVPEYEGALVTDGKDDMIVSQKTVQEMLGGSNVCTVVSMIHQINLSADVNTSINNIRSESVAHVCVRHLNTAYGKTGIFGYSKQLNTTSNPTLINNILGDKKDYIANGNSVIDTTDKYFVQGYKYNDSLYELSEVAVYWTFISNKVLTTDEINQIIAYFKLDKYVTPQVIYDVKRQGLTNDTPAADWYLKDFSGNGHDMQLYNYAKTPESGINEEGGLQSDGVNDYGKAEGLPIFKDYTVAIDRAWTNDLIKGQCLTSKLNGDNFGSFSFELIENGFSSYSFGISNKGVITIDSNKKISYQSKYVYNGSPIISGNNVDGKDLFLFRNRDSYPYYAEAAIWSYILFPYSLSEFLLERQLKKYKLGTLYPGMIEWRPIFNSNVDIDKYNVVNKTTNKQLSIGDYFAITDTIELQVYLTDKEGQEITSLTINGKSFTPTFIDVRYLYNIENFGEVTGKKSPQKINITIDEYIRYEDIVQPYPAIINLKQDGKTITWGDKLKVGSDIVFAGSANLLPELYTVSETRYNGVTLYPNTIIKVEKSMVFDNARTYLKANEPSCILSPNRLRIPNSSYKILGYIPDLTGKGNHGVINNSAYVGMSGANGYVYNWNTWRISKSGITSTITDNSLHITSLKGQYNPNQALFETNTVANTGDKSNFKVNITGLTSDMKCTFNNAGSIMKELINGVNEISVDLVAGWYGFMITTLDGSVIGDCDITIQQIGQYEGSFCLDGVDDYITIPTLAHGGKQVLMKVNLQSYDRYLYDQRNSWSQYLAIVSAGKTIAYEYSNKGGKTYIDGILNEHIIDKDLLNITHNITATNANIEVQYAPNIGTSFARGNFAQMALFDFMLFPEISSEDEIKKLNDVMGIEGGYVESPNYYWDAYGKANIASADIDYKDLNSAGDAHKQLIDKSIEGLAAIKLYHSTGNFSVTRDRRLYLNNVAYNSESGYEGINNKKKFPNTDGTIVNSGWATDLTRVTFDKINDYKIRITNVNHNKALFWYVTLRTKAFYKITGVSSEKPILFGEDVNNSILVTADTDGIYEVDWKNNMSGTTYGNSCIMAGFTGDCNITIEQVAQYPNGLVSDGVEDHLINTTMPILTDYTWIVKRKWLDLVTYQTFVHKGAGIANNAAFLFEYIEGGFHTRSFSNVGEGKEFPELISYQTKNNYNGTPLTPGSISDGNQLRIFMGSDQYPRYTKAVFYKAMLYDKTIDQLSINMLKNMFERDELIDVTNPIFKKKEL